MDPVLKRWMFEQWVGDRKDTNELAKNHAYLLASFDHPEAIKQLVGQGNVHVSSEEEFDESSRMVREANLKVPQKPTGRKRRKRKITEK